MKSGTYIYTSRSVLSHEKNYIPLFLPCHINKQKFIYVKTFSSELYVLRQSVNFCVLVKYYFYWKPISIYLFSNLENTSDH